MKKRTVGALLAGALFSSLLLTACGSSSNGGGSSTSDSGATELTVWAWDANYNVRAFEEAEKVYDKEVPDTVDLKIVENAQDDIIQKLNTSLSSGVTDGLPNIVLIEDYRAKSFLEAYPDSFFPLTDVIKADDFTDYKVEATSVDGENYAVPFDTSSTGLYVRTDILEEAGYTVDDLKDITWEKYIEIGKAVSEKTGKKLISLDVNDLGLVRSMINSTGSWYTGEDGKTPTLADNEALKVAFKDVKAMYDAKLVDDNSDWSQWLSDFNNGVVWSVPTGNWITPSITAQEDQAGKWAVVSFPRQELDGSVNASNLGGASIYVLNVDGKEAAAEFLKDTFGSSTDLYKTLVENIGAIGSYIPATEAGVYDTEAEYFGGQTIYKDFAEWSTQIPAVNYGENTYAIEDILIKAMQNYLKGDDLDKVLENAQKEAENQLK
ncbi:lactose/L-arabinose transport system substrate-binding protein [Streptococcus henryi]|jgi:lactose/L-arabinose transport system substrate-binding protein|uniref:Lactose/L-arabinose transport system substrate-binding protein n=1 Tax=Streptococcus henryi TaxID=439219 RepID=A0A1G6B0T1_9STRE|nr:extracellular solute-binding protein [Streptococcus henryi]SDB14247.1 lactose/L-arabinose transport system substrate-binding protein [Streptococcus henryi]